MYRLVVESLLGIERVGERLVLAPQLPCGWPGFRLQYRYRATTYAIDVRVLDAAALRVDGVDVGGDTLQLVDDGLVHRVELHVVRRQEPSNQATREQSHSKTIP
jgi:cellobiose phosphorylase